jgi:F0F1-type ATP synthase assembly protein I
LESPTLPKPEYTKPETASQKLGRVLSAVIFGVILGGIGGALIVASLWGDNVRWLGATAGAVLMAINEAVFESRRSKGEPRHRTTQLLGGVFFGAILGWLVGLVFAELTPWLSGLALGFINGVFSLQSKKFLISVLTGLSIGGLAQVLSPDATPVVLGALVVPVDHVLRLLLIREDEPVVMVGQRIPPEETKYVVPFEANSGYVGTNFFQDLARTTDGVFKRNTPGIGLIDNIDVLQGPTFNPGLLDPRIREFYEHTSDYSLVIIPIWDLRYKPLFWFFKRFLARPIGQVNLPFNTEEAQRGIVSYIDTIDFSCDDIIDLRGWIRAYRDSQEAIYVGIYTTIRVEDAGYVSVGFPLPAASFTATLLPFNLDGGRFLLRTRETGLPFPGHYLTMVDKESGNRTVMKLPTLDEEIEVYIDSDQLKTDHRFYFAGLNFLTLYYTISKH